MSVLDIDYNSVASFEKSKLPESRGVAARVFTVLLLAVFFVVLMTGLAAGVSMYQAVANNQIDTNRARMQAGLLASNVRANDVAGSIGSSSGPEGIAFTSPYTASFFSPRESMSPAIRAMERALLRCCSV